MDDDRPATVTVDIRKVKAAVNPRALGINVNYLMDDESRRPAGSRPLSDALRELGARVLRYPGGDKSDSVLWSRPPWDRAVPTLAVTGDWDWPASDRNLVGEDRKTWRITPLDFDRYTKLAASVRAESALVVCLDAGFQSADEHHGTIPMDSLVENAVEWVRYAKKKGFAVRCWEIGNESYFHVGATTYAEAVARFGKAIKEADPEARIGTTALNGEAVGQKDKESGVPWNKVLLERAGEWIDYLIVHDYPNWGWKGYAGYVDRDPDFTALIRNARRAAGKWAAPAVRDRLRVALTEYGTIDYAKEDTWANVTDLGHSLVLIDMIGRYLGEPDLDFATMWNTRWVGNAKEPRDVHDALTPDNRLTPTGMALAIWARFLGTEMLEVAQTKHLKVYAMHSPETGALAVFLLNKPVSPHRVTIAVENATRSKGTRWVWSGSGPADLSPRLVDAGAAGIVAGKVAVELPPASLTVLAF